MNLKTIISNIGNILLANLYSSYLEMQKCLFLVMYFQYVLIVIFFVLDEYKNISLSLVKFFTVPSDGTGDYYG